MTLPCLSPSTWISIWRGSTMNFSMNTRSSPKEDLASERARAKPSATSALECAMRMPLPPPPADALIITGNGGHFGLRRRPLALDLVAHGGDRLGIGADEDDAGFRQRLGKGLALGQKAVA